MIDDGIDFIGNGLAIGGGEIADAVDGGLEDFFLGEFVEAVFDVFPEILDESFVVGDEVGQGRYDVETVSFYIVDAFIVFYY